jgi:hypothetical protein
MQAAEAGLDVQSLVTEALERSERLDIRAPETLAVTPT